MAVGRQRQLRDEVVRESFPCSGLQQTGNCRAGLRPPEQRLWMGTPAEVIHEPEHRVPTPNRHGCKLLPIHRLAAAHVPFRGGSNGQGQELPVPIHRRAGQVD